MKTLKVTDENGKVYEFEYIEGIELLAIREDIGLAKRIIGYNITICGLISPKTWNINGECCSWVDEKIGLTPYDKFKDLKRAYSEGAIIEYWSDLYDEWREPKKTPLWANDNKYRIKGNLTIEQWDYHDHEVIKAWWEGKPIEFRQKGKKEDWYTTYRQVDIIAWRLDYEYRIKEELKPCPFCGGKAKVYKEDKADEFTFVAACTECFCEVNGVHTKQEAINAWNIRVGEQR